MLIAMNLAKQPCCFAEPQSGSAQRLTAFRHQIIIITRGAAVESIAPEIKSMAEVPFYSLMEQILSLPDVQDIVRSALSKEDG